MGDFPKFSHIYVLDVVSQVTFEETVQRPGRAHHTKQRPLVRNQVLTVIVHMQHQRISLKITHG